MQYILFLVIALISVVYGQINICKYQLLTETPADTYGYYQCTADAVNDRICTSTDDWYQHISCETKSGGAVNILTEFDVRYLLLGDAYAAHYLLESQA
mgnify:CR=1 FL=1